MKVTMYELLGLVKDGKAPKKIKYQDEEYIINKICLEDNKTHIDYYLKGRELLLFEDMISIITLTLNDTVEIIEEKKIPETLIPTSLKGIDNLDEKIEIAHTDTISVIDTVNEIIDYLDYLKSKGE